MGETLRSMLADAWRITAEGIVHLLPRLVFAVLILLVGLIVGRLLRAVTLRFFIALRLDRASDRLGISALLTRGDARHTVAEVVATVVYWLVLLLAFQMLGSVLGLESMAKFFREVLNYLPKVVVAALIVLVGVAIGAFIGGGVQVAAANAGMRVSRALGRLVKYAIVFFSLALAFEQLEIANQLLTTTFLIVTGAAAFAAALSFGLGCKDLAREAVSSWMTRRETPRAPSFDREGEEPPRSHI